LIDFLQLSYGTELVIHNGKKKANMSDEKEKKMHPISCFWPSEMRD